MRTRRSPRNQERLWRALGQETAQPKPVLVTVPEVDTITAMERRLRELIFDRRVRRDLERALARAKEVRAVRAVLAAEVAKESRPEPEPEPAAVGNAGDKT